MSVESKETEDEQRWRAEVSTFERNIVSFANYCYSSRDASCDGNTETEDE